MDMYFVYALGGFLIGSVVTFLVTKCYCCKSYLSYEELEEVFLKSKSATAISAYLDKMAEGSLPYPRWGDVMRLYRKILAKDVFPIEHLALWTFAEKYKKQKQILKKYPECRKIAQKIRRGEYFHSSD